MKKKLACMLLALAMATTVFSGCASNTGGAQEEATTESAQADDAGEEDSSEAESEEAESEEADDSEEAAEGETTEGESAKSEGQPMDPSVMKPWINSSLLGEVTDETTAEAKDDFYLNTNHDWLRDAKLRPGMPTETPVFDAMEIVKDRCLEFLTKEGLSYDDATLSHDLQLIRDYYALYLDWEGRNELGAKPFEEDAKKIQAIESLEDMTEYLLSEDALYNGIGLFNVGVDTDLTKSDEYCVIVASTDLSLEDSDEYKTLTENGKRLKKAVDERSSYMLGRIGIEGEEAQALIDASSDFETKVAANIMGVMESNDPDSLEKTINSVSMEDIRDMQGPVPLADFMEKYGFSASQRINLMEPEWLKALAGIYTEENLEGMKAYLLTSLAKNDIDRIDEEAFRKYQEITNSMMGVSESMPDDELAYEETKEVLPYCFDRLYVKEYVTEDMRKEIADFCQESVDVYREMLSNTEWMSEATRNAAVNKLDHLAIHSLYPDKWEDDSIFQIKSKEDGGTYLEAQESLHKGLLERQISHINQKVDKDIWGVDILETNAFYNPVNNSINIIPGYFCDVTYRSDMSIEEKYGAIGSVIGHEISHAFDTSGSQFDADGNVSDWWTAEDKKAFRDRANKLVKYFDDVVAFDDGTKYSGQMVQTEAIADMAGIKCMLMMAKKVDGFDYDKFFRANAVMWERVYTVEACERAVLTDTHPIHYLRANVTLPQYDEFIDTYGIKEGDGMYFAPEDRIAVW